jgi:hypothetical protein
VNKYLILSTTLLFIYPAISHDHNGDMMCVVHDINNNRYIYAFAPNTHNADGSPGELPNWQSFLVTQDAELAKLDADMWGLTQLIDREGRT